MWIYLKLFITIQPLRVMTGPYFQSLHVMTGHFSHYAKWLKLSVITRNDWFHRLTVTYISELNH